MRKILVSIGIAFALIPATALAAFNVDLRQGDRGGLVVELQQFLIGEGYLATGNATGFFGPLTFEGVQGFQSSRGVQPVSGFFGPLTRAEANARGGGTAYADPSSPEYATKVALLLQQIQQLQGILASLNRGQSANPNQNQCPVYAPTQCGIGYTAQFSGTEINGCRLPDTCKPIGGAVSGSTLIVSPTSGLAPLTVAFTGTVVGGFTLDFGDGTPALSSSCGSGTCGTTALQQTHVYTSVGVYSARLTDANGPRSAVVTVASAGPGLTITIPAFTGYIDRGYGMNITWKSTNVPADSKAYIALVRDNLGTLGSGGVIASALATSGSYNWTIPLASSTASTDYHLNPKDIIGGQSYRIRIVLYTPYEAVGVTCPGGCSPLQGKSVKIAETNTFTIGTLDSSESPDNSKDEQRFKDLKTIQTALEAYENANGSYPGSSITYYWIDDNNFNTGTGGMCASLSGGLKPYLSSICTFLDPAGYHYAYRPYGNSYKLGASFDDAANRGVAFIRGPNDTIVEGYYEPKSY